ncbi:MAG: DUF2235 domain-containing protein [Candidatus Tectomicrobia bacterium]|nr:DUF2235 domain-containing protein [Candidatus Tectomicrobia bacterium]
MALYAFDGTWNENEPELEEATNVVKCRDIYGGPVEYREGVGTRFGVVGRVLGGLFGVGGRSRIEELYDALRENWQHGDHVVDIIGFSRGAALAVHFANILAKEGVHVGDEQVHPEIRFLGLWDIVGSFGIPVDFIIHFQEINLGWTIDRIPATVQNCFHAMALDERRDTFEITRPTVEGSQTRFEELWFKGVHSDVGGGNRNVARSNIALHWMLECARDCGLPIREEYLDIILADTDRLASISENLDPIRDPRREVRPTDRYHPTSIPQQLAPGETATFPVRAANLFNWSGVRLQEGAAYRFDIGPTQRWQDGSINCGPDGWRTEDLPWHKEAIVSWFEDKRRVPEANWFALIGSLGDEGDGEAYFHIGSGGPDRIYRASRDGDLYAFANDLTTRYDNNEGQIEVSITRER